MRERYGQKIILVVQLNSKAVNIIELSTKVCTGTEMAAVNGINGKYCILVELSTSTDRVLVISGGSRICRGGGSNSRGVDTKLFWGKNFAENCMKIKEFRAGGGGCGRPSNPSSKSVLVLHSLPSLVHHWL